MVIRFRYIATYNRQSLVSWRVEINFEEYNKSVYCSKSNEKSEMWYQSWSWTITWLPAARCSWLCLQSFCRQSYSDMSYRKFLHWLEFSNQHTNVKRENGKCEFLNYEAFEISIFSSYIYLPVLFALHAPCIKGALSIPD